jgi:hypothetical protein
LIEKSLLHGDEQVVADHHLAGFVMVGCSWILLLFLFHQWQKCAGRRLNNASRILDQLGMVG